MNVAMSTQVVTELQPSSQDGDVEMDVLDSTRAPLSRRRFLKFGDVAEAKGFASLGVARGAIVMSNIFLSTSLIRLASIDAGCSLDQPECTSTVYGFRPSSLITNIAIVSGLLSAFLMPVIGAVVDYTRYRRLTGVLSASSIIVVQTIQIGTVQSTWFVMAILQAIAGFLYMVQVLAAYSYLPDIGKLVGESKMTSYTARFTMMQNFSQFLFLMVITAMSMGLGLNDVHTAQLSQGVNVLWIILSFGIGWMLLPSVPALHVLQEGKSLLVAGFVQIWRTTRGINKHYAGSLRWFFIAKIFADAGANAFVSVAVTFMVELIQMSGSEVGIVFFITLLFTLPGSLLGAAMSRHANPKLSWQTCLLTFTGVTLAGGFVLTGPDRKFFLFIFSALWGAIIGWFYATENLIFAMSVPKGQESELTGFSVYCSQVLTWLPPLVFTALNETGLPMQYGLMSITIFFIIATVLVSFMDSWVEVLRASETNKMIAVYDNEERTSRVL